MPKAKVGDRVKVTMNSIHAKDWNGEYTVSAVPDVTETTKEFMSSVLKVDYTDVIEVVHPRLGSGHILASEYEVIT